MDRPESELHDSPGADQAAHQPTVPARGGRSGVELEPSAPFRLLLLFVCLVLLVAAPYLVGQFKYQTTYNELKAGADVASGELESLKPRLSDFMMASRLVAKRVGPSVVSIFRPGRGGPRGQGSGVIVDKSGYLVTNYHVVEGLDTVAIRLSDGRQGEAAVVGDDPATDLAVLKTNMPNLIATPWGDSDELDVGDLVWAMGSPFGLEGSITFGIVSAKNRRADGYGSIYQEYLQTDAAVNQGNSGGPLVNIEGKVIGINTAIVGPAYQGISFAIPSTLAREQYEKLRENGRIERGYLGIRPTAIPLEVRESVPLPEGEGVYVALVQQDTPAARAGLQRGDVILRWNDHVATDPTLLSRTIASTEIGSKATMIVARPTLPYQSGAGVDQLELEVTVARRLDE